VSGPMTVLAVGSDGRETTILDRAVQTVKVGGYAKEAASRCGVHEAEFHRWLREGARLASDLLSGRTMNADLSKEERDLVRFHHAMVEAEAEGMVTLLSIAHRLSVGGVEVVEETVTQSPAIEPLFDQDGRIVRTGREAHVETKRTTKHTLPDSAMIRWRLERRYPAEYGRPQRVEVSGPDGGPIELADASPIDALLARLDAIAATSTDVIDVDPDPEDS
jgi:hypothetical protein